MSGPLILQGVTLFKDDHSFLRPIDCRIDSGRPLVLMGPSGSGKSTLLSFLIGSLPPAFKAEGSVWLGDADVTLWPTQARRIGILFQDDLLFPHLSVAENLGFGLPKGLPRRERHTRILAGLAEAEISHLGERNPLSLSGGERARVALMRTLLAEPKALLLDEPFAKLDIALRERFRRLILDRAAARHLPVLLVSHDPADAEATGGSAITL